MAKSVFLQERICTTVAKAKEARKLIEKLITLGKKDTLAARRRAFAILCDHKEVSQLFSQLAPRFKSRTGGYTRIIPYKQRSGDNAKLAFLELTEKSREIVTGRKLKKANADKETGNITTKVSDAETKPVVTETPATPTHSHADVKTAPKAKAKPTGIRKLFQRKIGAE